MKKIISNENVEKTLYGYISGLGTYLHAINRTQWPLLD